MIRLFSLAALCLFLINPAARAQKNKEDFSKYNLEIGIRHNGHINFIFHPKIGLPGGPLVFPTSSWYKLQKGREHYYHEGIGISAQKGFLTYRLWVDYYHFKRITDVLSLDTLVSGGFREQASGFRFSPGVEKEGHWKFMSFRIGIELPVYFQNKKRDSITSSNPNDPDEMSTLSATYSNGLKTIGLSAFAGMDFHFLKRMSAGFELSNGFLFTKSREWDTKQEYYNAQGELYKTTVYQYGPTFWRKKPRWFYLIPSVNLSYRF